MTIQYKHFEATDLIKSISYVTGQCKHFEQHLRYIPRVPLERTSNLYKLAPIDHSGKVAHSLPVQHLGLRCFRAFLCGQFAARSSKYTDEQHQLAATGRLTPMPAHTSPTFGGLPYMWTSPLYSPIY